MFTQFLNQLYQRYNKFIGEINHLLFPDECIICNRETIHKSNFICHLCEPDLEYSKMEISEFDSKTKKLFWGRIPVEIGYSLLYFQKGNSTQKILHNIKYENKKKLTFEMGKKIGEKLKNTNHINEIDVLIPVPIHKNKKFERGYNQSYLLSKGISSVTKIETNNQLIFRKKNSKSQTRLNKFLRWENAQNTYSISTKFTNQQINHIAIIDDVITTGSTIESISQEILKTNPNIKISVISLALAV